MTTNVQGLPAPGHSSTHSSRRRVQLIAQVLTIRNQRFDHGAEVSSVPRDGSPGSGGVSEIFSAAAMALPLEDLRRQVRRHADGRDRQA